jgi:hypothetical protein
MTATLPSDLREVFARCPEAELVTVDEQGRPRARAVASRYRQGGPCIDVVDAPRIADPHVALLFTADRPVVLVQGTAYADDALHVRPERVYAWDADDAEPRMFDAHLEEVRSGHNEEPEVSHAAPAGGRGRWDTRLEGVSSALLACVGPDGFPFAARLDVTPDPRGGVLRLPWLPVGMPVEPGPACLDAADDGGGGGRVCVHGDLLDDDEGWRVVPHAVA